jgi:hypothetical protein
MYLYIYIVVKLSDMEIPVTATVGSSGWGYKTFALTVHTVAITRNKSPMNE